MTRSNNNGVAYENAIIDRIVYFSLKARGFHEMDDYDSEQGCGVVILQLADCLADARKATGNVPSIEGFYL